MARVFVIRNVDGTCAIVRPTPAMFDPQSYDRQQLAIRDLLALDATKDDVMAYIAANNIPAGASFREIDDSQLPADRVFRNAWTDDLPTDTVDVDIKKAQAIKQDTFRALRKPLLEAADIEYLRALEAGDTEAQLAIAAKKQALRDITKIKLPDDIELLAAFVPKELR